MKKLLLILLLFVSFFVQAEDFRNVKIVSIYDGDTFTVDLGEKFPEVFRIISVRIYGIDTPEIKTKNESEKVKGLLAKNRMIELLESGEIILKDVERDKYFRLLAKVFVSVKGKEIDVAKVMVKEKHAKEYFGGTKENW